MSDLRWSHCGNGLRSHDPVPNPDPDRQWMDDLSSDKMSVCQNCGYYVWLTAGWRDWPSRTSPP